MSNLACVHETARPALAGARAPRPHQLRLTVPWLLAASLAATAAACQFDPSGQPGGPDGGGGGTPDARDAMVNPIDADPDQPDANCNIWPFTPKHFDPCGLGKPVPGQRPLLLDLAGEYTYNTDTGLLTYQGGAPVTDAPIPTQERGVQTIWVDGFAIEDGVTLRVVGMRPLMIVSTADILVRGTIDVSSEWNATAQASDEGAGSQPSDCSGTAPQAGGECNEGAGGGGGGGFNGAGGKGGDGGGGRTCDPSQEVGGSGGSGGRVLTSPPSKIRGGCAGARGANGDDLSDDWYGLGGAGGGAVHLVSGTRIRIEGAIHAGGAAGAGAEDHRSGGGGGGSGGFIGLEAPDIEIERDAILAANGGGGGGGTSGGPRDPGTDGQLSGAAAAGGEGHSGGTGGEGSAGTERDGAPGGNGDRGGGGGGGGAGYIIVYQSNAQVTTGATISPPLTRQ